MPAIDTLTSKPMAAAPRNRTHSTGMIAGLALIAMLCGWGIAVGGNSALFLLLATVACIFIVMDFRFGVVLLIMMLPIANSSMFPHELLGVTGLNPFNVLLVGTLAGYYLRNRPGEAFSGFIPQPLILLYILPIIVAGILGARHVNEIAPQLIAGGTISFNNAFGYVRDMVIKPFFFVLFALLLARAVVRSQDPEKFMVPIMASVWIMLSLIHI